MGMTTNQKITKLLKNPLYFMEFLMKVVNKNGDLVPLKLNPEQKYLLQNEGKYNIILKSRQLGISTLAVAQSLYIAITKPHSTCLLMSYSIQSADEIFSKLKQLYTDMAAPFKVPIYRNNKKELRFTNGSHIVCTTCGNKDVARGSTIQFAHISEVGFCKDTIQRQLIAIEQALTPHGTILLESTANGMNYFQELWAKAERGDSMYKPFFFSWINDKLMFEEEYKEFCDRYKQKYKRLPTVDELKPEEKILSDKGASIEQLVWRRLKIANTSKQAFTQEFPSEPLEAFVSTGSNIFSPTIIHDNIMHIDRFEPIKTAPSKMPVSLKAWLGNELTIWKIPKLGTRYYIGVDTGEGVGKDYSAFEVIDANAEQVAEFKSNKIKPYAYAEIIRDIGIWYNKANLVVEKMSAGHTVTEKLYNEYRYRNMYSYMEYDTRSGRMLPKVGWQTNTKSKPILVNDFVELFERSQMIIKSRNLLQEMKVFEFKDGKMNAVIGSHDDLVMAMGMAIQGVKCGINYS